MKTLVILFSFLVMTTNAFSATILSKNYDWNTHELTLDVRYSGGCSEHFFDLKFDPFVMESFPVRQNVELTHKTDDLCEALIYDRLVFNLDNYREKIGGNPADLIFKGSKGSIRVGFFPSVEGIVEAMYAIGGETTGLVLLTSDGQRIEFSAIYTAYEGHELIGKKVRLFGLANVPYYGVEIEERFVFEAFYIEVIK